MREVRGLPNGDIGVRSERSGPTSLLYGEGRSLSKMPQFLQESGV